MKSIILTPNYDGVSHDYAESIVHTVSMYKELELVAPYVQFVNGASVTTNRFRLVQLVRPLQVDGAFLIDADMGWEIPDLLALRDASGGEKVTKAYLSELDNSVAFAYVPLKVFNDIKLTPYFKETIDEIAHIAEGEDAYFLRRLKEEGYEVETLRLPFVRHGTQRPRGKS